MIKITIRIFFNESLQNQVFKPFQYSKGPIRTQSKDKQTAQSARRRSRQSGDWLRHLIDGEGSARFF